MKIKDINVTETIEKARVAPLKTFAMVAIFMR